ncbi:MAG: hypothetical protein AAGA30_04445 [Planctomycetota bacterium]
MSNLVESFEKAVVKLRRRRVSKVLFDRYRGEVQRGPFSGLKLDRKNSASKGQLGLKIFGLYESVVVEAIQKHGPYGDLINIGACDGYFTLGLLKSGLAKRSICFETVWTRQRAIRRYADNNGLGDQVVVMGKADQNIGFQIAQHDFDPQDSLMICDIEGAEFDLLTENFLAQLSGTTMIVELHDRFKNDHSLDQREDLITRLPNGYQHQILTWQPPNFSGIPDFDEMSDNDRALATSEGRKTRGEWLFAWPD